MLNARVYRQSRIQSDAAVVTKRKRGDNGEIAAAEFMAPVNVAHGDLVRAIGQT